MVLPLHDDTTKIIHKNGVSFQWLQVASYYITNILYNIFLWDWRLFIWNFIFIYTLYLYTRIVFINVDIVKKNHSIVDKKNHSMFYKF